MKTITADCLRVLKKPDHTVKRRVYFKRRFWSQSTRTFIWETNWTEMPADEIISITPILWQLDVDQPNEFKVSNVTIVARNDLNQWGADNSFGYFGQDDSSPVHGYEPYWTKFQVRAGFILEDGSEEILTLFSGVLTESISDSETKRFQMTIQGLEALLQNTKAEDIATTVTQENVGTGNSSNKDFTTANPGVGGISLVTVDGITKIEGSDYSISQLNEQSLGGKITFVAAPDTGKVIRATYFYWPQGQEFHTIVAALVTAAGISAGSQQIEHVVFQNDVLHTETFDNQTQWDTGTKTDVETSSVPGSLKIDWASTNTREAIAFISNGWSEVGIYPATQFDFSLTNPQVGNYGSTNEYCQRACNRFSGRWDFSYTQAFVCDADHSLLIKVSFIPQSTFVFPFSVFPSININPLAGTISYGSASGSIVNNTSKHTVSFVSNGEKTMKVYFDGTFKFQFDLSSNLTKPILANFYLGYSYTYNAGTNYSSDFTLSDCYFPKSSFEGIWTSATINAGATPKAWLPVEVEKVIPTGGYGTVETRTSANGSSWDDWLPLDASNIPTSTLRQYIQIRVRVGMDTTYPGQPEIRSIVLKYTTSSIVILLPDFTGLSVYEALQSLAQFTNYEFGFDAGENFFYRSKLKNISSMDLKENDLISKISGMTSGYEKVYGIVKTTYGSITKEISSSLDDPLSPIRRVSTRRYENTADSNIKISPTADIATNMTRGLLEYLSKRRRRFKMSSKFLPQLDLEDVVTVYLKNNTPPAQWYLGDPSAYLGQENLFLYGGSEQFSDALVSKIVGIRYDTEKWDCEFDLEEVA